MLHALLASCRVLHSPFVPAQQIPSAQACTSSDYRADFLVIVSWHSFCVSLSLYQDATTYVEENGLFYLETSAKTALNVNELFFEIGTRSTPR